MGYPTISHMIRVGSPSWTLGSFTFCHKENGGGRPLGMVPLIINPIYTLWVFPKIGGKPPKWMVKIMENPIKMDDLGVPLFLDTPICSKKHPPFSL